MPVLNKLSDRLALVALTKFRMSAAAPTSVFQYPHIREMVKTFFDVDYRRYGYN